MNQKSGRDNVILFVRFEGGNYICLGSLKFVAYDLDSTPVRVKWRLVDIDKFKHDPLFLEVLENGSKE